MNSWDGMGRITRDLELTTTEGGLAILKFGIAINRRKKGEVDFINCVAFDKTATNISTYFKKGAMIAIQGRLQTGSYEKDGKKVYTADIIVDQFHFTGGKKEEGGQAPESTAGFSPVDNGEDELPF